MGCWLTELMNKKEENTTTRVHLTRKPAYLTTKNIKINVR
jgi:hypothetical protein